MSANIIDSLFVGLGFEIDDSKLDEFKAKAQDLKAAALGLGAIFAAAAGGVGLFVQHVAEGMADINDFAELNEMSAKSVAALGKIASENDSSLDAMKSSIGGLNRVIGEAVLGVGRGAMTFQKLGLSAKDSTGQVKKADAMLKEIADKMQSMSRQEQIAFASKLGIDESLVKLLAEGGDNLAKLRDEAELMTPFTDRDYELADEIDKLFVKAKNSLGVFSKMLAVQLMPTVRDVLKAYLEWFKGARKATSGEFAAALNVFSTAVRRTWEWTVKLASGLYDAGKWLIQTKVFAMAAAAALAIFASVKTYDAIVLIMKGVRGLAVAMAGFNATALIVPAIIGAIALAIGALIDDWMVWKEGGDSVIGSLIEQFPMLEAVILAIEDAVRSFGSFFLGMFEQLSPSVGELGSALWNLIGTIAGPLWEGVKLAFQGWAMILAILIPPLARVGALIANVITTGLEVAITVVRVFVDLLAAGIKQVLSIGDAISNVIGKVSGFLGGNSNINVTGSASGPASAVGGVLGKAGDVSTSNASTTTNSVQVTAPITINSPDPAKAGESVRNELNRVNRQATRNGESAVAL